MYSVNRLQKRSKNPHAVCLQWSYSPTTSSQDSSESTTTADIAAQLSSSTTRLSPSSTNRQLSVEEQKELGPALDKFYAEITRVSVLNCLKRTRGVNITVGADVPPKKLKKKSPLKTLLEENMMHSRLHCIASLDPLMNPRFSWPFVACGGEAGIVHLFNPQKFF